MELTEAFREELRRWGVPWFEFPGRREEEEEGLEEWERWWKGASREHYVRRFWVRTFGLWTGDGRI